MKNVMRDYLIRSAFHQSILLPAHNCADTFVIDELGLKNGEVRADIAVLNGKFIGYEIKTDSDNLSRLPHQIIAYSEVFDEAYIVTGKKHLSSVLENIPKWWGVYIIESNFGEYNFMKEREAEINLNKSTYSLAQLLWKDEVKEIITYTLNCKIKSQQTKTDLYSLLSKSFTSDSLTKMVLTYLTTRNSWRTNRLTLS
jgi:hypothetical protein